MTETPEQQVARLEAELAQAKVEALQKELDAARGALPAPPQAPVTDPLALTPFPMTPAQPFQPAQPEPFPMTSAQPFQTTPPEPVLTTPAQPFAAATEQEPAPTLRKPGRARTQREPQPRLRGPVHLDSTVSTTKAAGPSTWLPSFAADAGPSRREEGQLAPGPRSIPGAFRAIVFPFSFWTLFALFMVSVTPIAVWIFVPVSGAIAAGLTFVVIAWFTVRRRHLRHTLLKWGEVATVTSQDTLSRGTYYSGTTYSNVRLAQAHGWTVTRQWYSGPGYKTRVDYSVGSGSGSIVIRGLPYDDGVILADPRHPERALCVSSFPYDLHIDESGAWVGRVSARVLASSIVMTVILLAWTAGMIALFAHIAMSGHGLVRG